MERNDHFTMSTSLAISNIVVEQRPTKDNTPPKTVSLDIWSEGPTALITLEVTNEMAVRLRDRLTKVLAQNGDLFE